ncbi:metalloendopeptidase [Yamadazyma tenuis]|uniref:Peptidase M48 domain-containing protein n=1 Tax=Candida tenuis (strain ATCC 10573 / BCRC 21748 / CBS 615 / JCM 9827 / NBRC 10315 / NRRL Y-1498 / VKM Y-70) TaxID=590646 RepID=G3B3X8_CANTC|nr:uncharacterized protein CANTEDRAFT_104997 [Yamadazyma tenuis ATCC 10573]EGV63887.1 hypothetical protein CANTEDRAFT_104997 [Yamadazyma tenuis ATCC 10573]WEJ96496.1 metalloendopeptidase [Yamadazyma tenuis]
MKWIFGFRGVKSPVRSFLATRNCIRTFSQSPRSHATYKRFENSQSYDFSRLVSSKPLLYTVLGLGAFYVYNQDEAPFTNRRRFLWVPYWMEKRVGDMSYRQILLQYKKQIVPHSDPIYAKVSGIVNRLLEAAFENSRDPKQIEHLKSLKWEIHVIQVNPKETPPNAFILPNGKIFIFSSILPICHDTNGIATVLSHELSHQLAHHSMEQLSKQPVYMALSTLLYMATGVSGFNDLLIAGLLTMPASREMESEADRIGCELMARSCFDIYQIPRFWERMHAFEEQQSGQARTSMLNEFFSTHPNTNKRIHDIQSWMPQLESISESSNCHQYGQFNQLRSFF